MFGVITVWVLLEGSKALYRLWAQQNSGAAGIRGTLADDVLAVTG